MSNLGFQHEIDCTFWYWTNYNYRDQKWPMTFDIPKSSLLVPNFAKCQYSMQKFYIINVLKLIWQKRIWKTWSILRYAKLFYVEKPDTTYPIMKSVKCIGRYQTKGLWNTIGLRFRSHQKLKRKLAVHIFFFKEKLREVEHGAISFPKTLQ